MKMGGDILMIRTGNELAQKIAKLASDKKAEDILLLSMEGISPITDYFMICSAGNSTLVTAIADNIEEKMAEEGILPLHKEGYAEGRWILMDYGDLIVHIFSRDDRLFYDLERIWRDGKDIDPEEL